MADSDDNRGSARVGQSDDGHVQMVLDHTGMVQSTAVDPRVRDLGAEELAVAIQAAYGEAREDLSAQPAERQRNCEIPDPYETQEKLLDLQEQSLRQSMSTIQAFGDMTNATELAAP